MGFDVSAEAYGQFMGRYSEPLAQRFADLAVFIRQTHGDRDLAELGATVAGDGARWEL